MPDFDFVGDAYTAPSIYQDAQECINWFPEIDSGKQDAAFVEALGRQNTRGVVALYPTPGTTVAYTLPTSPVRAMRAVSGSKYLFVVAGNAAYAISAMGVATVGTIESAMGPVSISDNGSSVYFVDGSNRYSWAYGAMNLNVITASDGAFTGGGVVDICDNCFVYNWPGTQQWAASTALSTVTPALSFSSKDGAPDNLVTLIVNNRQIYLLGEATSEVWTDVGTFPFPFARVPGSNSQFGCAAAMSVAMVGNSFIYLSRNPQGQAQVMLMQGYTPTRISTHAIEYSLLGVGLSDAFAYGYQMEGHSFYVLTIPGADLTWVYDMTTNMWHKWLSVDAYNKFHRHFSSCAAFFNNQTLVGDAFSGNIYALSKQVYTDNGNTIRRLRRAPHLTADLQRMYFDELQIQFQPGVGLESAQGQNPQAMLRWSNDGGSTWSNEHWCSIGAVGHYRNRAIWRRLGWSRDRIFEVIVSDPVNAVVVSANLKAGMGDN